MDVKVPPALSVSVTSYNSTVDLARLISGLVVEGEDWLEILVHENGKPSAALRALSRQASPRVSIVESPVNLGFGAGHNANLRRALGEYFLILNPDTAATPDTLRQLVRSLTSHEASAVAPLLRFRDGSLQQTARALPSLKYELSSFLLIDRLMPRYGSILKALPPIGEIASVEQAAGAAILARSSTLRSIGGFDEQFFLYFEDVDLCARLAKLGPILIDGGVVLEHAGEGTARAYRWQTTALIELSRQIYFRKHSAQPLRRIVQLLTVLRSSQRALLLWLACCVVTDPDRAGKAKGYRFAARYAFTPSRGIELLRGELNG